MARAPSAEAKAKTRKEWRHRFGMGARSEHEALGSFIHIIHARPRRAPKMRHRPLGGWGSQLVTDL